MFYRAVRWIGTGAVLIQKSIDDSFLGAVAMAVVVAVATAAAVAKRGEGGGDSDGYPWVVE